MTKFSTQPIVGISAGQLLTSARLERGLNLLEISRVLKIPKNYLVAMEAGEWNNLPEGAYRTFFIRQYATFLNVSPEPILRKVATVKMKELPLPGNRSIGNNQPFLWRRRALWSFSVAIFVYLVWAGWTTFWPPKLVLESPQQDFTTSEASLMVKGDSRPGTTVTINSAPVGVTDEGKFIAEVPLSPGLNTVTIAATKSLGRKVSVTRQVLYRPAQAVSAGTLPSLP